jgi:hypothetical protein
MTIIVSQPIFNKSEAACVFDFLVSGDYTDLGISSCTKLLHLYFTSLPLDLSTGSDVVKQLSWVREQYAGWPKNHIHDWVQLHTVDE